MPFTITLAAKLDAAYEIMGSEPFVAEVERLLREKAGPGFASHWEFLRRDAAARGNFQRAIKDRKLVNSAELATLFTRLDLPQEFDGGARMPWCRLSPNPILTIVAGIRLAKIPKVARHVEQRVASVRDMEAALELQEKLTKLIGSRFQTRLELIPSRLARNDARATLQNLRRKAKDGALVIIGSPVTNPLADAVAETIFGNQPPPAQFVWGTELLDSLLSARGRANPAEEGIRVGSSWAALYTGAKFLPRMPDDLIRQKRLGGSKGPLPDAGMLLIDASELPVLIVAAGHGGCGTKACVRALASHADEIDQALRKSMTVDGSGSPPQPPIVGYGRLCVLISVDRKPPSKRSAWSALADVDAFEIKSYKVRL